MRLARLRRAEQLAHDDLSSLLAERAETLREIGPNERSCDYGYMARHEILIAVAGVRAMRQAIRRTQDHNAIMKRFEALPELGEPLTGPEDLSGVYYPETVSDDE